MLCSCDCLLTLGRRLTAYQAVFLIPLGNLLLYGADFFLFPCPLLLRFVFGN